MSQYGIISISQRTINIINCTQEGASLISKNETVKEKMCICFNVKAAVAKWIQSTLIVLFEFMLMKLT